MSDDEIVKQNRDTLLERMNESGNAYSDEYPYGLMGEAEEEIKLLRKERDEARRLACKNAGILRCVVDPDQDIEEWAKSVAWLNKWDCYKETTKFERSLDTTPT